MNIVAQVLKEIIEKQSIKPIDIAKRTGLSKGYIASILNGSKDGGNKIKSSLVKTFYVNPYYLLTGEGSMFIGESPESLQEYSQLSKLLKENKLPENEMLELLEYYLKPQSKKAFKLLISASQGDKAALSKLRQCLDALEMLFDE